MCHHVTGEYLIFPNSADIPVNTTIFIDLCADLRDVQSTITYSFTGWVKD